MIENFLPKSEDIFQFVIQNSCRVDLNVKQNQMFNNFDIPMEIKPTQSEIFLIPRNNYSSKKQIEKLKIDILQSCINIDLQEINLNGIQKITGHISQKDIDSKMLEIKMKENANFDLTKIISKINQNFMISEKITHQNIIKNVLHKGLGIIEEIKIVKSEINDPRLGYYDPSAVRKEGIIKKILINENEDDSWKLEESTKIPLVEEFIEEISINREKIASKQIEKEFEEGNESSSEEDNETEEGGSKSSQSMSIDNNLMLEENNEILPKKVSKEEELNFYEIFNPKVNDFHFRIPKLAINFNFNLDDFQKRAILSIEEGKSIFVSAPTSAGKTAIAEYAVALAKNSMQKAIYTSPIKALSNQKYAEFRIRFPDVGILTGDVSKNPNAQCLIVTAEILQSFLYKNSSILRDLAWVIIDEVHYVSDDERGYVWEEIIIMLPKKVKIVMLSATAPNNVEFSRWVGATRLENVRIIEMKERPIPLEHHIFAKGFQELIKNSKNEIFPDNYRNLFTKVKKKDKKSYEKNLKKKAPSYGKQQTYYVPAPKKTDLVLKQLLNEGINKEKGDNSKNDQEKYLKILIEDLKKKDLLPAIVFCFSRNQCELYAKSLEKMELITKSESQEAFKFYHSIASRLDPADRDIQQIKELHNLSRRGIGVHHAGILPTLKEMIEVLFSKGLIKVLFATTTFAMGVNMPARTTVFQGLKKFNKEKLEFISSSEYNQMAGRAGRRGKDDKGIVIVNLSKERDLPPFDIVKQLIEGKGNEIRSKFRVTYKMLLFALSSQHVKATGIIQKSFAEFNIIQEGQKSRKELENINVDLTIQENILTCCKAYIQDFFKIFNKISTLNQKMFTEKNKEMKIKRGTFIKLWKPEFFGAYGTVINILKTNEGKNDFEVIIGIEKKYAKNQSNIEIIQARDIWEVYLYDIPIAIEFDKNQQHCIQRVLNDTIDASYKSQIKPLLPKKKLNKLYEERNKLLTSIRYNKMWNCKKFNSHVMQYGQMKEYEQHKEKLENKIQIANLEENPAFRSRIQVLKEMNYIDKNSVLLLKGQVARELASADIILLTEILFEGIWRNLKIEEFIALISIVIVQEKKLEKEELLFISPEFDEAYEKLENINENVWNLEKKFEIETIENCALEKLNTTIIKEIYFWAKGSTFAEICNISKTFLGSLVRGILRIDYALREMKSAARIMGDQLLKTYLEKATEAIHRGIIFTPSLYLEDK